MKSHTKKLLAVFLTLVLLKIIIATIIPAPAIFSDEYIYSKMAQSFHNNLEFSLHGTPTSQYPPLYPILMSIAYKITEDMTSIYLLMKIINSIISSLIIFPAYYLAREILNKKQSLIAATLIGLHTTFFNFSNYITAENLYYPLFLTSIYFMYRSIKVNSIKNNILLGIFIGLTILTKVIGVVLIPILIIVTVYKLFQKEFSQIKTKIIAGALILITTIPWLIRNKLYLGSTTVIASYQSEATNILRTNPLDSLAIFSNWYIIYICFLIISSGVLLGILSTKTFKIKEKDMLILFGITSIAVIALISNHNIHGVIKAQTLFDWFTGRPIGRYLDQLMPLVVILGIKGLEIKEKISKNLMIITATTFIIGSQVIFFKLFPANNLGLFPIGIFKVGLEKIYPPIETLTLFAITTILLLSILFISYKIINKASKRTILTLIFIIFIGSSILGATGIIYHSQTEQIPNPYIQTGLWINENIKEDTVTIDSKYCKERPSLDNLCNKKSKTNMVGFFVNKKINFSTEEKGIFITKDTLPHQKVYSNNGTNIYQIENEEK